MRIIIKLKKMMKIIIKMSKLITTTTLLNNHSQEMKVFDRLVNLRVVFLVRMAKLMCNRLVKLAYNFLQKKMIRILCIMVKRGISKLDPNSIRYLRKACRASCCLGVDRKRSRGSSDDDGCGWRDV